MNRTLYCTCGERLVREAVTVVLREPPDYRLLPRLTTPGHRQSVRPQGGEERHTYILPVWVHPDLGADRETAEAILTEASAEDLPVPVEGRTRHDVYVRQTHRMRTILARGTCRTPVSEEELTSVFEDLAQVREAFCDLSEIDYDRPLGEIAAQAERVEKRVATLLTDHLRAARIELAWLAERDAHTQPIGGPPNG